MKVLVQEQVYDGMPYRISTDIAPFSARIFLVKKGL